MSPLASAVRQSMYPTEFKGGGLKKVVAVAAMVFIPMAAPAISGAIATSGFLGASATGVFSTWAGSAIVGAGLGAVSSAVTGQDWKRGALMGGIGGGIAGYSSGMGSPFGSTATPTGGMTGPGFDAPVSDPLLAPTSAAPTASVDTMIGPTMADGTYGGLSAAQEAQVGLSSLDYNDALLADQTFVGGGTTQSATGDALDATAPPPKAPPPKAPPPKAPPPKAPKGTFGERFQAGLKTAYSPENLAKASLQMGGNLLSNALISNELPAEQQAQINAAQAVVDRLEAQGAEVDELKLAAAKLALRDANNISIEWLRQQKYAQAKNRGSRQTRDAVRTASAKGYNQAGMPNVYRRGGLETEKAASTAGEQAALGAYDTRGKLFAQANSMFPTSTGTTGYRTSMQSIWDADAKRKEEERKAYGNVWAGLTGQGIS